MAVTATISVGTSTRRPNHSVDQSARCARSSQTHFLNKISKPKSDQPEAYSLLVLESHCGNSAPAYSIVIQHLEQNLSHYCALSKNQTSAVHALDPIAHLDND